MYCKTVIICLLSLLISRLNKPHSFNLFSQFQFSKPLIILIAPHLAAFQYIYMGFFAVQCPKMDTVAVT